VALSEVERDRYRTSRFSMDFLGNKNGQDIYRDRVTNLFYVDDGWDVRVVGRRGWRPHVVDLERLKGLLARYSPGQLNFSEYILATYIDKEQQLWDTIFRRYELPKEPKKPTFGKSIRKQRWARYDEEYEQWQKEAKAAKQRYRSENEKWKLKKQEYDAAKEHAASGTDLLRRALTSSKPQNLHPFKVVVPPGKEPGDILSVNAGGRTVQVQVPAGSAPGTEIQFEIEQQPAFVQGIPTASSLSPPDAPVMPAPAPVDHMNGLPPPAIGTTKKSKHPPPTVQHDALPRAIGSQAPQQQQVEKNEGSELEQQTSFRL